MTPNDEIRARLAEYPSETQSHKDLTRLLAENEQKDRRIENLREALCTIADRAGEGARGSDRFGYEYMHGVAVKALEVK